MVPMQQPRQVQVQQTRGISYYDRTVGNYASKPIETLTLPKLVGCGEGDQGLVDNCRFVHEQVAVGLARRIVKIHELPYICGINPHMQMVYTLYVEAFQRLTKYKPPQTMEEQHKLTAEVFATLLTGTRTLLPIIAKASKEIAPLMDSGELSTFVDTLMQGRISRRLLVENHLLAHSRHQGTQYPSDGIITAECDVIRLVKAAFSKCHAISLHTYRTAPELLITGPPCTNFAYVPSHITYMLLELFKNAIRATVERQRANSTEIGAELPPIEVSLYRGAHDLTIKVRDQGGGIGAKGAVHVNDEEVFEYAYTTIGRDHASSNPDPVLNDLDVRPIAGEGFGELFSPPPHPFAALSPATYCR
jgi:hypothetical protein